jgi:hypothetical protein
MHYCICMQGVQTNTSSETTNRDVDTTQENTSSTGGGMEVSHESPFVFDKTAGVESCGSTVMPSADL